VVIFLIKTKKYFLRDFQIKKYPNYFLWNGLLARPDLKQAGSPLHKIGEIISWKSVTER
jgi:hypothetical protein